MKFHNSFSWTHLWCFLKALEFTKDESHFLHLKGLLFSWMPVTCTFKLAMSPKRLLQYSHPWFLDPSWTVLLWIINFVGAKVFPQISHFAIVFLWTIDLCNFIFPFRENVWSWSGNFSVVVRWHIRDPIFKCLLLVLVKPLHYEVPISDRFGTLLF